MDLEDALSMGGLVSIAVFSQVYGSALSLIRMEKGIKHSRRNAERKRVESTELGSGENGDDDDNSNNNSNNNNNNNSNNNSDNDEEDSDDFMRIDRRTALLIPAIASVSLLLFYYYFNVMSFIVSLWVLVLVSQAIAFITKPVVFKYVPALKKMRVPSCNRSFFNTQILCCLGSDDDDNVDNSPNNALQVLPENTPAKKGKNVHVFSVFIHLTSLVILVLYLMTGNVILSNCK